MHKSKKQGNYGIEEMDKVLSVKSYELAANILPKDIKEVKETKDIKTATNIKYLNVKLSKGLKSNPDIIYIIKDADELCVRILLFFLCYKAKDLEKIDFDFFKTSINADTIDDSEILCALNFWKNQKILNYGYEALAEQNNKGVNMDNIISIISNIRKDINIMNTPGEYDDSEDLYGFDEIYRFRKTDRNEKTNKSEKYEKFEKCEHCDKFKNVNETDKPDKTDKTEQADIYEDLTEEPAEQPSVLTYDTDSSEDYKDYEDYEDEIEAESESENNITGMEDAEDIVIQIPQKYEIAEKPEENEKIAAKANPAVKPQPVASGSISIDKLSDALETSEDFQRLYQNTQIIMRSMFNTAEIEILYNLYEINKIEVDLILNLAEIFVEDGKDNIRYLEKFALGLAANGILTYKDYEASLEESKKVQQFENKIRNMFNVGSRKFTPTEKNNIKTWVLEFDFPDDVLMEGYKICLSSKKLDGKASINYINGIYKNWHEKGFKTLDDIKNEFGQNGGFSTDGKKPSSFNLEQFFEKAAKKSMNR